MPNDQSFSNHLTQEKSPYLLQHAHNPVDWYPWGKEAFEKACNQDKPVLLSIGYSTCHWCHVMAHESFENEAIAQLINSHFIAIKVDREERPDIDHIYMTATTAMTGQGGWPLTAFLTPQGDPFYCGTYFPPYAKWGSIGFIDLLNSIAEGWQKDKDNIVSSGRSITENLRTYATTSPLGVEAAMDENILERAYLQMEGQFDPANGGLGHEPKFPMGHNLSFLLRYYKSHSQPQALTMVNKTLSAMAAGGIYDHLGGGFHRYSTDRYWRLPHFEKMLYDQALLSRAYLEAYQITASWEFAQAARETLDYVLKDMTDPQGGFYCAQDADSLNQEGYLQEGSYYVFSQAEIEQALGVEAARVFNFCYGILPQGNAAFDPHGEFKGKNILHLGTSLKEAETKFHKQADQIQDIIVEGKIRLLSMRSQRTPPHKDDKVLCDWNGLMIASFSFASRVLGDSQYAKSAAKAADFILSHMMDAGRLLHRWREGQAGISAGLEDYAFFINALLELYEAVFEDKYLNAAQDLADDMIKLFEDKAGGFFMTAADGEKLIIRPKEIYDGAIPSGNSVAALLLLKLYAMTQKEIYNTQAQALLGFFASRVSQAPSAHSFLLSALDWQYKGPLEITFEGDRRDPTIAKMLKVLYKYFVPFKTVKFTPTVNTARALICYRGRCLAPIDRVEVFEQELQEAMAQ